MIIWKNLGKKKDINYKTEYMMKVWLRDYQR